MNRPFATYLIWTAMCAAVFAIVDITGADSFTWQDVKTFMWLSVGWWLYHFIAWKDARKKGR